MAMAVALLANYAILADEIPERMPVAPEPQSQTSTIPNAAPSTGLVARADGTSHVANGPMLGWGAPGAVGCWDSCGLLFRVDLAFLRYHQSGGVRDSRPAAPGTGAEFDFNFAPRYTLGWEFSDGLGVRANYWRFDESEPTFDGTSFVGIEAQTFDLELYRRVCLMPGTSIEVFGGFRWVQFTQTDGQGLNYDFSGMGATVGIEGSQSLCCWGRVYARARWSIIMGDATLASSGALDDAVMVFTDNESTQTELALGWDNCCRVCNCANLVYGFGLEWHQWSDAAIAADQGGEGALYDAGWAGFVFRVGLQF
jgi:hypothetical protein